VEIPNYNKHLFFKLEAPHSIVNYLENNFTENVDVSKSKFQREVFELFNFVRRRYDIDPSSRVGIRGPVLKPEIRIATDPLDVVPLKMSRILKRGHLVDSI